MDSKDNCKMPACNQETLGLLRGWAALPELIEILHHRGVNLGDAIEYHMFPAILETLSDKEPGA